MNRWKKPLLTALMIALPFSFSYAKESEEDWYRLGKEAISAKNWDAYNLYKHKLSDSSLLPYLEYSYYQATIKESDPHEILHFASRYSSEPFSNTLRNLVFTHRSKNRDYRFILDNANYINSPYLRCYLYEAQMENNELDDEQFQQEWLSRLTLPSNCATVEKSWLKKKRSFDLVRNKVEQLIDRHYLTRAKNLLPFLPEQDAKYYSHFIELLFSPQTLLEQEKLYSYSSRFYRLVIKQWAKKDSVSAQAGLDYLKEKEMLSHSHFVELRNQLAIFQAGRSDAVEPLKRILNIPSHERTDEVLQWGFRLAAQQKEYLTALELLNALSDTAKSEDTWAYWLGRMYELNHEPTKAKQYLESIAHMPTFYGFLAADLLNHNYSRVETLMNEERPNIKLQLNQSYMLGLLLAIVDEENFSRLKWRQALNEGDKAAQHAGSLAAYDKGYYNLSLQAAARAQYPGGIALRYPSVYLDIIQKYSDDQFFTNPIILGLIRQESLFHERAKSQANAYGLMQLLIPTAKKVSEVLEEENRDSLYNPDANIRYGVTYLQTLKDEIGACMPYVLASYNAGPHKVKQWLEKEIDDIALWIESIPYYETRGYVKNVLGNAVIYHYLNDDPARVKDYLQCQSKAQ